MQIRDIESKDSIVILLISFLFVLLLGTSNSPLYLNYSGDAMVFKTMALLMDKGGLLYEDLFDHKGFYIYLFNHLGRLVGGNLGIFFLMVVSLYLTFLIWLKIILLLTDGKYRYVYLGITLWLLAGYYFGGDFTEDVSLPFISLPLLIYINSIKNNRAINIKNYFLIGVCFGILTFIRINNAFPFVFFIVYNFFYFYKYNKLSYHIKQIISFITGVCLAIAPAVVYFAITAGGKGIENMLFGTFIFNFDYKGNSEMPMINFGTILFYSLIVYLFLISVLNLRKIKHIAVPLFFTVLVSPFFIGSRTDIEYLVLFTPLCIIAFCFLASYPRVRCIINFAVIILLGAYFMQQTAYRCITNILYKERYEYTKFEQFVKTIDEEDKKRIYNYANFMGLNLLYENNIIQCNRIILPFQLDLSENLRQQESEKNISYYNPKYILVDWNFTHGEMSEYDQQIIKDKYNYLDSYQMGRLKVDCFVKK